MERDSEWYVAIHQLTEIWVLFHLLHFIALENLKKQQMRVWGRSMDWGGNQDIYKQKMIQCNSSECNSESCLSFFCGCIMTLNIKFGTIHCLWRWTHSRYLQQWIETHISVHHLCKFSSDLLHVLIETRLPCLVPAFSCVFYKCSCMLFAYHFLDLGLFLDCCLSLILDFSVSCLDMI